MQSELNFGVERQSMPVPTRDALVACPNCNHSIESNRWSHPKCTKCKHHNAVISGVCRDCGEHFPKLANSVEYCCNVCEWVFYV